MNLYSHYDFRTAFWDIYHRGRPKASTTKSALFGAAIQEINPERDGNVVCNIHSGMKLYSHYDCRTSGRIVQLDFKLKV